MHDDAVRIVVVGNRHKCTILESASGDLVVLFVQTTGSRRRSSSAQCSNNAASGPDDRSIAPSLARRELLAAALLAPFLAPAAIEAATVSGGAKIFVAGATGNTGKRVVAQLSAKGYKVLAGTRVGNDECCSFNSSSMFLRPSCCPIWLPTLTRVSANHDAGPEEGRIFVWRRQQRHHREVQPLRSRVGQCTTSPCCYC